MLLKGPLRGDGVSLNDDLVKIVAAGDAAVRLAEQMASARATVAKIAPTITPYRWMPKHVE